MNGHQHSPTTLYEKVFSSHTVKYLGEDEYQLYVGLHLIHEASSAPAFGMLRERTLRVFRPDRSLATSDHLVETNGHETSDPAHRNLVEALERNSAETSISYIPPTSPYHGIVHIIGPELGLTQPGMVIVCGDSHTTTHGAFGALAFGIGTTQVRDVLASQTLVTKKHKVRRIEFRGQLKPFVTAKDLILFLISQRGAQAGIGFVYEFAGDAVERLTMEERMTLCNMAVEAGAAAGYVNPDETTFSYLKGRTNAPTGASWDQAINWWKSIKTDEGALFDDLEVFDAAQIDPMLTWGTTLEQACSIEQSLPASSDKSEIAEALQFMGLSPGQAARGIPVDVAFIGSCTNGRLSDFMAVARLLHASGKRVAEGVRALAVPGSENVRRELVANGAAEMLTQAGFDLRQPGCSMCIGLNSDKLHGREACASSSNRNFRGRQGSPVGRTFIMSPLMVAAAAVAGSIVHPAEVFGGGTNPLITPT